MQGLIDSFRNEYVKLARMAVAFVDSFEEVTGQRTKESLEARLKLTEQVNRIKGLRLLAEDNGILLPAIDLVAATHLTASVCESEAYLGMVPLQPVTHKVLVRFPDSCGRFAPASLPEIPRKGDRLQLKAGSLDVKAVTLTPFLETVAVIEASVSCSVGQIVSSCLDEYCGFTGELSLEPMKTNLQSQVPS